MFNMDKLRSEFEKMMAKQEKVQGRKLTGFTKDIYRVLLKTATLTAKDTQEGHGPAFRPVSAPTGSGKSTGAAVVIAAAYQATPSFSCAYLVDTVHQAEQMGHLIGQLVGRDNVTVWTRAHDVGRNERAVHLQHEM